MMQTDRLMVTTPSDREIAMSRVFDAPRHLVYDAYTKPELLKRWLGVFGGWSFKVCEVDLKVGGRYRFVWTKDGHDMGMGGSYREIVRHERIVSDETFDDPWYEGQALATTTFVEKEGRTTLGMSVRYDTKAIRDAVLQSPMETGVAASFDALAGLLARPA